MRGYPIQHPAVDYLGRTHLEGIAIPHVFFQYILVDFTLVKPQGKGHQGPATKVLVRRPHLLAIFLMAEVLYWYRPIVLDDESHPERKRYAQKFKADTLQLSYEACARKYGVGKHQVREAFDVLEHLGLVTIQERTVKRDDGTLLWHVHFIAPVIEAIQAMLNEPLAGFPSEALSDESDGALTIVKAVEVEEEGALTIVSGVLKRSLNTDPIITTVTTHIGASASPLPPVSPVAPVGAPSETSPATKRTRPLRRRPMPRRLPEPVPEPLPVPTGPTWKRTWKASKVFPDDFPQTPPEWFLAWALAEAPDVDVRQEWKRMLTQEYHDKKSQFFMCAQRWMLIAQSDTRSRGRSAHQPNGHGRLYSDVTESNLATMDLALRRKGINPNGHE